MRDPIWPGKLANPSYEPANAAQYVCVGNLRRLVQWLSPTGSGEKELSPDDEICYCFHVTRRKLVNYVRLTRPRVPSQLSECGGAGTGCGWCIPFLRQLHQQGRAGAAAEPDLPTPEEYARRRAAYIRAGGGTPPPGATPLPEDDPPEASA